MGGLRVVWERVFRVGFLIMYLFSGVADVLSFGVILLVAMWFGWVWWFRWDWFFGLRDGDSGVCVM